jgi:hypothetical protein
MAIITPAPNFIREEEVRYKAAVSEATFTKMGASINYILSRVQDKIEIDLTGYYFISDVSTKGYGGLRYFESETVITSYYLSNSQAGLSGSLAINFDVYDETGVLLGNLFTTPPSISYLAGNNAVIGRNVENSNDINPGSNKVVGTLNFTTFPAGYSIRSKVTGIQDRGYNGYFQLLVREA